MEEVNQQVETLGVYKQDIDDNCPMTGDETDTDTNTYLDEVCLTVSSHQDDFIENKDELEHTEKIELLPRRKKSETLCEDVQELFPIMQLDDGDESFSSDRNYLSDEETSSVAGSYDDLGRDEEDSTSEPITEKSREEKLRSLALRRHLDQLGELVVEREYAVQQSRDELQKCREYLDRLEKDLESVSNEIKDADQKGQKVSFSRLKNKYDTLMTEISIERNVETKTLQNLEDAECYLAQTYIEHGKFLPLDEELSVEEKQMDKIKSDKASARTKKEMANAAAIDRKKRSRDKEHISVVRERERKNRQAVIAAKKNREVAMKYLKETMSRVRQRESEEEDKSRNDLNKKMNALLGLKRNIELNKENIKAVQAKDAHLSKKDAIKEGLEREKLLSLGEKPDEVLTRRKRMRQFERDKEAFQRKQREREIEIVNTIISEEKQMKRRYQQQPQLWPDNRPRRVPRKRSKPRFAPSSGSESMEYGADVEDTGGKISYLSKVSTDDEGEFSPYGISTRDDDRETTEEDEIEKVKKQGGVEEEDDENEETFAKPEFKGLWEQDKNQISEKLVGNWKTKTHEYSKYEQEMMKTALSKQKSNIVQKQVAAGREFKGCAFYSKPEIVLFKDFDVGKIYRKKVLLTNVSYSQNYCQYVGISDKLKDFIDIGFIPPGPMSAGLTCDLAVTFKPMINEDIDGTIEMMAQTGLFYIPIKCLIKRCEVSVDVMEVDFDGQVVGETRKKAITLKNNGALAAEFQFSKVIKGLNDGVCSDMLSIGDVSTDQDETINVPEINVSENKVSEEGSSEEGEEEDEEGSIVEKKEEPEIVETNISLPVDNDGMRTGKVTSGRLDPFSSVQLDIVFAPTKPNTVECEFSITFTDPTLEPIIIKSKGVSLDLPVWVEREIVDLKICMYDRLYQDAVIISNRATAALRLRFEVPKELRNHLDMLPKTAYIQAESQFSVQLKFLPRKSLPVDAEFFMDKESGLLKIPIVIRVADQTQPVPFTVHTIVTSSDLEFNTKEVNFGYCTVYESVFKTIQLSNKSVLPQQYGFVATPETINVEPNNGFGTILPNEQLDIDISFSPNKAKEYKLDLICKSHIGREFTLRCKGIGVLPPLKLSNTLIAFAATAINNSSSTHIFVLNDHLSTNQFTHPVPRIGSGEIFPVGPTSFEFVVPKTAPFSISPCIGTILPGEKCMIRVTFSPKLNKQLLHQQALEYAIEEENIEKLKNNTEEKVEKVDPKDQKFKPKNFKVNKLSKFNAPQSTAKQVNENSDVEIRPCHLNKTQLALQRSYNNSFTSYKIPCFIASGECADPGAMEYDPRYALYLEVHCPSVRPSLIVVSDCGDNLVDFGKVSMGQRHTQVISIQNISDKTLTLSSSTLDPAGAFELVNAFRAITPNNVHSLKIAFTPHDNDEFYEVLDVSANNNSTAQVRLKGQGVKPQIELDPLHKTFDLGDALVMDTIVVPLKITNISELSMIFELTLGSLLSSKHSRTQTLPGYLKQFEKKSDNSFLIGPPNRSGLCVFSCHPSHGTLEPGECKEVLVSFSPDHPSELYRDELAINVNGTTEFINLHLVGRAWPGIMYARGWDRLLPAEESLAVSLLGDKDENDKSLPKTVLLTFHSVLENSTFTPADRSVELGCIKSNTQIKKSSDFWFENTKEANDKGFVIEPMKGGVDIGVRKNILFRWIPHQNYDPEDLLKTSVQLVVRGDTPIIYKIILRGYVNTRLIA